MRGERIVTESQLMYAAMLALTKQNMAFKLAPLSTATHSGMCINRNITVGETVGLYYHGGDSLLRMGDVPGYTNDFWVDDENRFYTYDSTNHRLIIKDGLSGETLDDTIDAYDFSVAGTKTCCAFKSSQDENEWVVILPDGSKSAPIDILSSHNDSPSFGYRNGIIGVCVGTTGSWDGIDAYTYTPTGQYLATMQKGRELGASCPLVLPISETAIVYATNHLSAFFNYGINDYAVASVTGYQAHDMWAESGYSVSYQGTSNVWLGADQSYIYVSARHYMNDHDEGIAEWTDEYYTGKISIDHYDGIELLETEISDASIYSQRATQKGTIVHTITNGQSVNRTMLDLTTMSEVYGDVLTSIPNNPLMSENDGFIWISGMGVYQKTPNGWLMYPTSEYPRNDDNQLLGYAIRNVKIGNEGLAIVLFE